MIYKTVVGPKIVNVEKGNYGDAVNQYAALINSEAQNGWEYVSMETLTVQQKVGCFINAHYENTLINMLIFKKEA